MPDADHPTQNTPHDAPADWSSAFAALPLETPPADSWTRLSATLPSQAGATAVTARRTRRSRRLGWSVAAAAALALAALLPIALRDDRDTREVPSSAAVAVTAPAPQPDTPRYNTDAPPAAAVAIRTDDRNTAARAAGQVGEVQAHEVAPPTRVAKTKPQRRPQPRKPQPQAPEPKVLASERGTRLATGDADRTDSGTPDALLQLQAESAQLEALVALARDERVGNATTTVMATELDQRIGLIDAALSQNDLIPSQRSALWQQRVQALQDLAGVEATQRWLAVQGESYDAALVHVD
ncbi:hypothetical protein ACFOLC_07855 [Lysobacter cavernae]|uniref:Uncharacterized protein n=1 Tax=Lysobacter cavernae TaxID=1685901 RepID=A0ABV7RQE2_9GAMM